MDLRQTVFKQTTFIQMLPYALIFVPESMVE